MAGNGDDLGDTGDCEELDYEEEYPATGAAQEKDEQNMEEDPQQEQVLRIRVVIHQMINQRSRSRKSLWRDLQLRKNVKLV